MAIQPVPEPSEAMIYDVELPSMTARFRIPEGLPFAAGMYRLEYLRTPTEEDQGRWAHLPEPEDHSEVIEDLANALQGLLSATEEVGYVHYGPFRARARAALAKARGEA